MRREEIPPEIPSLAFEFFYWFSRFEFALKECNYLRSKTPGHKAEANWQEFIDRWEDTYIPSKMAQALIAANPLRQVVDSSGSDLEFVPLIFSPDVSDFKRVVRLAQAVRNNLFHGGKHGSEYWDDPARVRELLPLVVTVLDEIAQATDLEADYRSIY
ncbi:hypothetical protein [Rhodophyticola sp.]|uniref:hypothetical protein n=1 Tax=Rhodophyticola sp. TaxID=2680032 RepID=UPI003D294C2E